MKSDALIPSGNIFASLPDQPMAKEIFQPIIQSSNILLERIISMGHVTPEGDWHQQDKDEWVLLLTGHAQLIFDNDVVINMKPGDYLFILAQQRHRVSWTDPNETCLWLALHANNLSIVHK